MQPLVAALAADLVRGSLRLVLTDAREVFDDEGVIRKLHQQLRQAVAGVTNEPLLPVTDGFQFPSGTGSAFFLKPATGVQKLALHPSEMRQVEDQAVGQGGMIDDVQVKADCPGFCWKRELGCLDLQIQVQDSGIITTDGRCVARPGAVEVLHVARRHL